MRRPLNTVPHVFFISAHFLSYFVATAVNRDVNICYADYLIGDSQGGEVMTHR